MRRRIIKSPFKQGTLTKRQIREAVMAVKDKYIERGRIGAMKVRISIDVETFIKDREINYREYFSNFSIHTILDNFYQYLVNAGKIKKP